MSDTERVDPRVLRTKQLLFEALLELIQEKRWDKIRVQDVLDRSGISRSAFYSHYTDKYDLLTGGMPEVVLPAMPDGRLDVLPLFAHVNEAAGVLRPLLSQPVLAEITNLFHRRFVKVWDDYLGPDQAVLSEFLAGAVTALVKSYALDSDRPPPEEYAAEVSAHIDRLLDR